MENGDKKETPGYGGSVSTIVLGCVYTDVRLQTGEGCEREEKVAKRGLVVNRRGNTVELKRYSPTRK